MQISLLDARHTTVDRTWLTNVYPLYLHDLSKFDDGYYHLNEQGLAVRSPGMTESTVGSVFLKECLSVET